MKNRVGPFLTTPTGSPIKGDYFRHMMRGLGRGWAAEGLHHAGLRYTAATRIYKACRSLERPDHIAWPTSLATRR